MTDIIEDILSTKDTERGTLILKFNRTLSGCEVNKMYHQITAALKQSGFKEDEVEIFTTFKGGKDETNQPNNET